MKLLKDDSIIYKNFCILVDKLSSMNYDDDN